MRARSCAGSVERSDASRFASRPAYVGRAPRRSRSERLAAPDGRLRRRVPNANASKNSPSHALRVDLAGQGDVAVLARRCTPRSAVVREALASRPRADEADRSREPRRRAGQRQRVAVRAGEQHRRALVVAEPGGVAAPRLPRRRRAGRTDGNRASVAAQRRERSLLQDASRVADRRGLLSRCDNGRRVAVLTRRKRGTPGSSSAIS